MSSMYLKFYICKISDVLVIYAEFNYCDENTLSITKRLEFNDERCTYEITDDPKNSKTMRRCYTKPLKEL